MILRLTFFCAMAIAALQVFPAYAAEFDSIRIVAGPRADAVERRYVELLESRLREMTPADIRIGGNGAAALEIHLGTTESYPEIAAIADRHGVRMPGEYDPGDEGFVLASVAGDSSHIVLGIGADRIGVLYAVGEILRRAERTGDAITFPDELHLRRAPRWPVRGLIVDQGHTMLDLTGAREWTVEEWKRAHIEYALAGANTFDVPEGARWQPIHDLVRDYGLRKHTIISGNAGSGPPEWRAKEAIGRNGYLSPAVPEARAALIEARENQFKSMGFYDSVHIKSGDGGGDESEAASPYGHWFIRLCEDYARALHKYHPETKVYVGNQKLTNAGDTAIFEYLQAETRDWCAGIAYGPGSNGMGWTPGRRQDHRMDLFRYGRDGALGGYLRYMLHQLPPEQEILLFTDITHWVYSQYGLMDHEIIADRDHNTPPPWDDWMYRHKPDEAMAMVYNRRTFHARPRNYFEVFQHTAPYAIGDVAYSEGHHDHVNAWIYMRLFWDPHQSVEEVVQEYARAHFGSAAAELMTEAVFTLEENVQTPIADNPGIDRLIELVEDAGEKMSTSVMKKNYLWRQFLEKAHLDKYIQLDVRRQRKRAEDILSRLSSALESGNLVAAVTDSLAEANVPAPTDEMESHREHAEQLGEESDRIYGVRNEGLFNLEQDYVGFGWLRRELEKARDAASPSEQRVVVAQIVHYGDPGEGGFYDNAGVPEESPRLIYGWPYGDGSFNGANRRSQQTMAFTTDEERGVTFRYTNLDRDATYRVKLTLVRPRYLERFGKFQHQTGQSIYADDIVLEENLVLPEYDADFFEYEVPAEVTRDGELLIWMKKQPGIGEGLQSDMSIWRNTGGWGTLVSEIWLMKNTNE